MRLRRRRPEPIDCDEVVEIITDYLEGTLDARASQAVEAHLKLCPGCAEYLAQMRTTIQQLGRVSADELSPHARSILLDAFRDWHAASGS